MSAIFLAISLSSKAPYIWLLFGSLFMITEILIPINIIVIIIELVLNKTSLKTYCCKVNTSATLQKIIYCLATISFMYYLWFKLYYEPILEKLLEFD